MGGMEEKETQNYMECLHSSSRDFRGNKRKNSRICLFFFSFRAFMKMMQGESCRSQKGK